MFTYLDSNIRTRLVEQGKLIRIDNVGQVVEISDQIPSDSVHINILGPIPMPIHLGQVETTAQWYATVRAEELSDVLQLADDLRDRGDPGRFASMATAMAVNSVLVFGTPFTSANPMVRVHSNCLTGDVFGSERCECGPQLEYAAERISTHPDGGMLVYMAGHEGRGIGLWAKAATYLLQDEGEDTYQANESLGLPADSRDFSDAASLIMYFLGNKPFQLLTNNPKKISALHAAGLDQFVSAKHVTGVTETNRRYLEAKKDRGHKLESGDID